MLRCEKLVDGVTIDLYRSAQDVLGRENGFNNWLPVFSGRVAEIERSSCPRTELRPESLKTLWVFSFTPPRQLGQLYDLELYKTKARPQDASSPPRNGRSMAVPELLRGINKLQEWGSPLQVSDCGWGCSLTRTENGPRCSSFKRRGVGGL